jgi:cytochrome oxidase Cu insertion factor (SCO1/SenC/PrrC family)
MQMLIFTNMKSKTLNLAGILSVLLQVSCSNTTNSTGNDANHYDRPLAPGFTSTTFDNTTFSLDEYAGKVVYIFFRVQPVHYALPRDQP